jgi:hypothetical protein
LVLLIHRDLTEIEEVSSVQRRAWRCRERPRANVAWAVLRWYHHRSGIIDELVLQVAADLVDLVIWVLESKRSRG